MLNIKQQHSTRFVVVVFLTLTDGVSTIPSNIRGCQSGTRSAGQEKIIGTSTKLQREHKNKTKTKQKQNKNDKNKGTITQSTCQKKIEEGHSIERGWCSASREPSSQRLSIISLCSCVYARTHSIGSQISPSPCDLCSLLLSWLLFSQFWPLFSQFWLLFSQFDPPVA